MCARHAPSPVAIFVALTRAVRDAAVRDPVRARGLELVERLARAGDPVGQRAAYRQLEELAAAEAELAHALGPLWEPLQEIMGFQARG